MAVTTSTVSAPAYLQPTVQAGAQYLQDVASRPYTPYTAPRVAGATPLESQAFNAAANYQMSPEFGAASGAYTAATSGLLQAGGTQQQMPSGFAQGSNLLQQSGAGFNAAAGSQYNAPTQFAQGTNAIAGGIQGLAGLQYNPTTFGGQYNPTAFNSSYTAGSMGPGYTAGNTQSNFTANSFTPGYTAGQNQSNFTANSFTPGYTAGQFSSGFTPTEFKSTYEGPGSNFDSFAGYKAGRIDDPTYRAEQTEGGIFGLPEARQYMDPYQQSVTDIARREAQRDFEKQQTQLRARAASAGAFGGSRATLLETENQRNQNQLLNDLQVQGSSAAYQNAQNQFNQDRAAKLQAFGLNEGARQTESQFKLDAQRSNEAAQLAGAQLGLSAAQTKNLSQQQAAELALRAQQMGDSSQQFAANNLLASFQANEAARLNQGQLGLQAQQLGDASQQFAANNQLANFQANEAARLNQGQLGLQAQVAGDASQQFAADNQLATFQANQAAQQAQGSQNISRFQALQNALQAQSQQGLQAQQLTDESNKFGFTSGLQGYQANEANKLASKNLTQQNLQSTLQGGAALGNIGSSMASAEENAFSNRLQGLQGLQQSGAAMGNLAANQSQANTSAFNSQVSALQSALQGAGGLASLGTQINNAERDRINQLADLGVQQRQPVQSNLDAQYQQFLDERDYPLRIADTLTGGISRLQGNTKTESVITPDKSNFENFLGGASSIAGLLGSLGGEGGASAGADFLKGLLPDDILGDIGGFLDDLWPF